MPAGDREKVLAFVALVHPIIIVLSLYAFAQRDWITITHMRRTTLSIGLLKRCVTSFDREDCSDNFSNVPDFVMGSCTRLGGDYQTRMTAASIFSAAGVFTSLLVWMLSAQGYHSHWRGEQPSTSSNKGMGGAMTVLAAVSSTSFAICCGIVLHTNHMWYMCDRRFCTYHPRTPCEDGIGQAGVMMIVCCCLSFVSFVATCVRFVAGLVCPPVDDDRPAEVAPSREPFDETMPPNAVLVTQDATSSLQRSESPTANTEWVWDDTCGLHWSQETGLYYDEATDQYYDPKSCRWYDPATGSWE